MWLLCVRHGYLIHLVLQLERLGPWGRIVTRRGNPGIAHDPSRKLSGFRDRLTRRIITWKYPSSTVMWSTTFFPGQEDFFRWTSLTFNPPDLLLLNAFFITIREIRWLRYAKLKMYWYKNSFKVNRRWRRPWKTRGILNLGSIRALNHGSHVWSLVFYLPRCFHRTC